MRIVDLLTVDRVMSKTDIASKKRALELSSQLLATSQESLNQTEIFDSLLGRERLGSTGLGEGVAIPHGRVPGLEKAVASFIQLAHGVDFDAIDRKPVDLIFALLVPKEATEEHLQILAALAEAFKKPELREALRKASNADEVMALLANNDSNGRVAEVYSSVM